jgi:hypothetical protein
MKAYVVIEAKPEDYHGTYKEVISVHATEESARAKVTELYKECNSYDTEYYFDTYNIEP